MAERRFLFRAGILYSIVAVTVVLGLTTHIAKRAPYTGDEPRYLLYALSLNVEHKPVMSDERYEAFRTGPGRNIRIACYPIGDIQGTKVPHHPILMSTILSPFARSWTVQQLRLICFLAGLIGLCFLAALFIGQKLPLAAAIACLVPPALFLPSLPYYFQALPEIFLFLLVCASFWNMLSVARGQLRDFWPSLLCGSIAPFFHLRGMPLTITVLCYVAGRVAWHHENKMIRWRPLLALAALCATCALIAIFYNRAIYGNILGSVNTARPMVNSDTVTAMFFGFRHGLFTYAPIYVLSFAGLAVGFWQRQNWVAPAALFLLALIAISAGPDPGESYPARFWVQGVPVLSLCLIGFTQGLMPILAKASIYVLLSAVSIANSVVFAFNPVIHMSTRSSPLPYEQMFELFPWIHLGFWVNLLGFTGYRSAAICYLLGCVALIAVASLFRSKVAATLAVMIVLIGFEIHRARPANISARMESGSLLVSTRDELAADEPIRLRLCAPWDNRSIPPLVVSDGKDQWQYPGGGIVVLPTRHEWPTPLELRISDQSGGALVADPTAASVAINKSWIVRLW